MHHTWEDTRLRGEVAHEFDRKFTTASCLRTCYPVMQSFGLVFTQLAVRLSSRLCFSSATKRKLAWEYGMASLFPKSHLFGNMQSAASLLRVHMLDSILDAKWHTDRG